MAFHPIDFEKIAEEILRKIRDKRLENAKARTVVSRVYYACFLAAREKLEESLPSVEKQRILKTGRMNGKRVNVHYLVIETFIRSKDYNHNSIGDRLDDLRVKRNNADYNLFYRINKPELEFVKAKQLRKDIEAVQNKHLLSEAFSKVIEELNSSK